MIRSLAIIFLHQELRMNKGVDMIVKLKEIVPNIHPDLGEIEIKITKKQFNKKRFQGKCVPKTERIDDYIFMPIAEPLIFGAFFFKTPMIYNERYAFPSGVEDFIGYIPGCWKSPKELFKAFTINDPNGFELSVMKVYLEQDANLLVLINGEGKCILYKIEER